METVTTWSFCGQSVNNEQIAEIKEIIGTFPGLSREELANTLCEIFSWKRPTGKLKNIECRQFLEKLCDHGVITLPPCRKQYANRGEAKPLKSKKTDEPQRTKAALKELPAENDAIAEAINAFVGKALKTRSNGSFGMNTSIGIITWGIDCPLVPSYVIL